MARKQLSPAAQIRRAEARARIEQDPHSRYLDRYQECQRLLHSLTAKLEAHSMKEATDQRNWGYVGDLAHIQEQLENLLGLRG